jgi:L-serine dehydratase
VAGLLGLETDDPEIRSSLTLAAESGLEVRIASADLGNCHPNTVRFTVRDREGNERVVEGSSIGGGSVVVSRIDDYEVELTGEYLTLVIAHQDEPGMVARVTTILAWEGVNIAGMRVSREKRGAGALMVIELDDRAPDRALASIRSIPGVQSVAEVEAVRL